MYQPLNTLIYRNVSDKFEKSFYLISVSNTVNMHYVIYETFKIYYKSDALVDTQQLFYDVLQEEAILTVP